MFVTDNIDFTYNLRNFYKASIIAVTHFFVSSFVFVSSFPLLFCPSEQKSKEPVNPGQSVVVESGTISKFTAST